MKKKVLCFAVAACMLLLCACSGEEAVSSDAPAADTATSETQNAETETPAAEETPAPAADGPSFADNVLTMDDYTITITDYKVIQPGETGNEYGEVPVIAFWYDTTNVADADGLDPTSAWVMSFQVVQDNDPNAVNTLNMGMLPDEQFMDSQLQQIKVGGTVSNAVAYELDDTTTPVTVTAQDILGNQYGSQEFAITQ